MLSRISRMEVQWRQHHVGGLSPALLGYGGTEAEKADKVLVVILD